MIKLVVAVGAMATLLCGCASTPSAPSTPSTPNNASTPRYSNTYRIGTSSEVDATSADAVLAYRIATESILPSGARPAQPPRLVAGSPPAMPREAIDRGISGNVKVRIVFSESGEVERLDVLESTHPMLEAAVATAVRKWRIQPHVVNGKPSKLVAIQSFAFRAE